MDKEKRQWKCMRDAVAAKAEAVIEDYRKGRYHGREVACILGELFEAANDTLDFPHRADIDAPIDPSTSAEKT